ncbi:MAG: DUF1002 domain-containing protein [Actinobacteria bacterium]|nr:DUF1002 domain-containing protein [Actinomycetota bacterium]
MKQAHRQAGAAFFITLAVVMLALLALVSPAVAAATEVVTLGGDLNSSQRQEMLDLFGVNEDDIAVLQVTIDEERSYLQGLVPDSKIGSRSISSVYVRLKDDGSGIAVQTKNITYVTEQTYANALVTAGIADADVFAAAPFAVSGTAALTGVFKAFEEATGETIPEAAKEAATEELVDTADIGEEVGDPDAIAELVKRAKEEIVSRGLDDEAAIREVLVRIALELNLNLNDHQIDRLAKVLADIQKLDLDLDKIQGQLKDFQDSIGISSEEAAGIWASIKSLFQRVWDAIFG